MLHFHWTFTLNHPVTSFERLQGECIENKTLYRFNYLAAILTHIFSLREN
jgi:hypothetical protein